jgi:hypothetical protein
MTKIIESLQHIQNRLENVSNEIELYKLNEELADHSIDAEYLTKKFLTPKTSFSAQWLNQFQEYI